LSVALPTCNGGAHLRETLSSIRSQDEVAFDLIVSDDRSDDETLAIVNEVFGDRLRVSINSERLGLAGNWNRCVELCRTEWVAIFHQDDVMHPGHLASHLRVIDNHPTEPIGIVAGPVVMIDEAGQPISPRVVDPGGLNFRFDRPMPGKTPSTEFVWPPVSWVKMLTASNPLRCSAVTIRKSAHQAVGGFDPSYRYVVDWDFWLRIAREWGIAWCLGPATVSMRWHPSSETHRFKTGMADLEETSRLLDAIDRFPGANEGRREADAILARAYLNRAHVALKGGDSILARRCLDRSIKLSPSVLATIAFDPRLAIQMATLKARPDLAVRWFGNRRSGE
jgi:GT2 family glycosyltransferase